MPTRLVTNGPREKAFIASLQHPRKDCPAVYDKVYVMPYPLRLDWRDAVDRLRSAQALFGYARQHPMYYGIVGISKTRKAVLHALDDLWGVQSRVELMKDQS